MRIQQAILFVCSQLICSFLFSQQRTSIINGYPAIADTINHVWYVSTDGLSTTETIEGDVWKVIYTPLPVVDVCIDPGFELTDTNAPGYCIIADAEGKTNGEIFFKSKILTRRRGATASLFPKKSLHVKFIDEQGNDKDLTVLGIREDHSWILDAMAIDYSRMRNRLAFDLWNASSTLRDSDMKRNGSKGQYVEVLFNGQYHGLYCLSDKINRKLLGLKKVQTDDEDITYRGLLYKCNWCVDGTNNMILPENYTQPIDKDSWTSFTLAYPEDYPSSEAWQPLIQLLEFTSRTPQNSDSVSLHIKDFFFVENFLEYGLFLLAAELTDNCMHNAHFSIKNLTKEDYLYWITPWDLDGSFGRYGGGSICQNLSIASNTFDQGQPYRKLYDNRDPFLMKGMAQIWKSWSTNQWSIDNVVKRIIAYRDLLDSSGAWERERERWKDQIIYNETRIVNLEEITEETSFMIDWYARNFENLNNIFSPWFDTNIEAIECEIESEKRYYNLMGIEIATPKGICIYNGKVIKVQ